MPSLAPIDGGLRLHSDALGLDVRLDEEGRLRFHDPETGEDLLAHAEETAAHRVTKARLEEEAAARRAAETRLEKEAETRKAEAETDRATKARLEKEIAVREARIAELETRLGRAP